MWDSAKKTEFGRQQMRYIKVTGQADTDLRSRNPSRNLVVTKYVKVKVSPNRPKWPKVFRVG